MTLPRARIPATLALLAALALAGPAARAQVPSPVVSGPIPSGAPPGDPSRDYVFFASELAPAADYVEEEFFLEGTARRYETPPLAPATLRSEGHPYKTRIVVRRPRSEQRFNGTVLLEWQNVTAGYDIDASWVGGNAAHFMREGYAWVGVSAQRVGVHEEGTGLRDWSPQRYGSLDVTDGGAVLDDGLAYDIFSQAAQVVTSPLGVDPLDGLEPRWILATGASQSAARLTTYYNAIQPLAGLFDGFLLLVGGGELRRDLETPVFRVFSETEIALLPAGFVRLQPDSDVHRTWQVAGAAHADRTFLAHVQAKAEREGIPTTPPGTCAFPEGSEVRLFHVVSKAHDQLVRWVRSGTPPPTAPGIQHEPGPPPYIVRDDLGRARGGIRLADLEAPLGIDTGVNSGPASCILFGAHLPFDAATLRELHPDRGAYLARVASATIENLKRGYITLHDAVQTLVDAARSDVGA